MLVTTALTDRLARRIFCSAGHYAPMTAFSKRANTTYQNAQRRGASYQVNCIKHTSGNVQELACEDCGEVKPLNAFSNSARKVNGSARCRDCVSWTEADTTTANPLPAPLEPRAPDELDFRLNARDELEEEFETLDEEAEILVGGMTAMSVGDSTTSVGRGGSGWGLASSGQSDVTSTAGSDSVRPRPTRGNLYTAYGPDGQAETRAQSVITTSDTTSITKTNITTTRSSRGFAKVSGRKAPIVAPDYLTKAHPDEPRRFRRFDDDSGSEDEC